MFCLNFLLSEVMRKCLIVVVSMLLLRYFCTFFWVIVTACLSSGVSVVSKLVYYRYCSAVSVLVILNWRCTERKVTLDIFFPLMLVSVHYF